MSILTSFTDDFDNAFTDWGQSITYTPTGQSGSTITAIFLSEGYGSREAAVALELEGADDFGQSAELIVKAADVSLPEIYDECTIGGNTWEVIGAQKIGEGSYWKCEIARQS